LVPLISCSSDQLFLEDGTKKGWFSRIDKFPEAAAWPKGALTETTVAAGRVPYVLLWNTNDIPQGLKGWTDVLDPKLKGKVLISDPRVVTEANGFYVLMRRIYGDDFIRKLGTQLGGVSPSANPGAEQIAAGADDAYVPGSFQTYTDLKAKGAPLAIAIVSPTAGSSFNATLVSKAPHPHVAELLLRYIMTPVGQTAYNAGAFSVLPNVPQTTRLPEMEIISGEEIARQRPEIIQLLGLH
jgi:iron(III) transport system substrate-binding protein